MNIQQVARFTETQARNYLESIRWPDGAVCPHCDNLKNNYKLKAKGKTRPGLYECRSCKKQFTVTVGTVMQDSHIPLSKWVMAFYLICSHRKGISARQLQHDLKLGSYRSAWHMCHRIRLAMKEDPMNNLLSGNVEVDETYVGGKPRKGSMTKNKRGRGTDKTPVIVLVERNGNARSTPVQTVDSKTLKPIINEQVHYSATIITDEWPAYNGIGKQFLGGHNVINHGAGTFSINGVNTNTAESYFALLKRCVVGTFHHLSKHHMHRYCDEFSFRWNTRKWKDVDAMALVIKNTDGKSLQYKQLVRDCYT